MASLVDSVVKIGGVDVSSWWSLCRGIIVVDDDDIVLRVIVL